MFNTLPANPFPPSSEQMGAGGGGSYELPVASAETLGGVKVGNNLSIDNGVLSAPAPYSLPTASDETLGGVKVGNNLSIADGVLSAPAPYTPPAYSTDETDTGRKWIDGSTIYERVYAMQSPLTVGADWVNTGITIPNISKVLNVFGLRANGESYITLNAYIDNNEIKVTKESTGWNNVTHIILQYTKTESEG